MYRLLKLRNLILTLLLLLCSYLLLSLSAEASALPKPTTGVMAQPTVPTPPPVIDLTITDNSGNAKLDWTDNFAEDQYEVHRSTEPFFGLDAGTLLTTLPAGTNTYIDVSGGIGNINLNYFYKIKATASNLVGDSNFVGEIDYPLNNTSGAYSMIGVPFVNPSPGDAAGLAAKIGNVSNIYYWDADTQSFQVFTPPNIDNFPLSYGDAIFVQVGSGAPASVNLVGSVWPNVLTLYPNNYSFITMPFLCDDELTSASDTAADITGVINLLQWERTFQSFLTFTPPNVGDDFPLTIGDPFIVQLGPSGPSAWPGYLTSICN